jgi:hypothetical protein
MDMISTEQKRVLAQAMEDRKAIKSSSNGIKSAAMILDESLPGSKSPTGSTSQLANGFDESIVSVDGIGLAHKFGAATTVDIDIKNAGESGETLLRYTGCFASLQCSW